MSEQKNLSSSLDSLFNRMENFITTKTVVGEPLHVGDIIILPLIDASFGLGASAISRDSKEDGTKVTEGGGLGGQIEASSVIVINQKTGDIQMRSLKNQDALGKIIDMAPDLMNKLQNSFKKMKDNKTSENDWDDVAEELERTKGEDFI